MATGNSNNPQSFSHVLQTLNITEDHLYEMAREATWCKRKPRKITPFIMLDSFYDRSRMKSATFRNIASKIDVDYGQGPCKQAVAQRTNFSCCLLVEKLIKKSFEFKFRTASLTVRESWSFSAYKRVLVQDSTIIKLPAWLYPIFSGVSNAHSKVCNARIQAVYDIKNMKLISFSIDSYTKNDLKSTPELDIRKDDLVLRDRGYLIMAELRRHAHLSADFIYRHKTKFIYLDPSTKSPINLLALLREQAHLDLKVLLNDGKQTEVRLIAAPVDSETANLRRMKAKKETKGHCPSREVLAFMDWTIFITNIAKDKADFKTILITYGLRWRIEIIFKAWKSHMNFDSIHRVSQVQLLIILKMRLLRIMLFTNFLYRDCYLIVWHNFQIHLSMLSFFNELNCNPERITKILSALNRPFDLNAPIWQTLVKYCCHEKRKRLNFHDSCKITNLT
jgi:hypothetical protein